MWISKKRYDEILDESKTWENRYWIALKELQELQKSIIKEKGEIPDVKLDERVLVEMPGNIYKECLVNRILSKEKMIKLDDKWFSFNQIKIIAVLSFRKIGQ